MGWAVMVRYLRQSCRFGIDIGIGLDIVWLLGISSASRFLCISQDMVLDFRATTIRRSGMGSGSTTIGVLRWG